jgi:UDP-GlcNAc:undecaprenyl-phosphate GlcNAc-1-phosphate transferase
VILAFLVSLVLALLFTPLAIRVAWATGYLDHPEARKLHTSATALLGGVVVFVCAVTAWIVARTASHGLADSRLPGILTGAVLALLLGMWDDRFGMSPLVKLLGQGVAAAILAVSTFHGGAVGWIAASALVFLVVALMNAVNFLDNMNGMVSGLSAILFAGFAWMSASSGSIGVAAAQLALAGACIGFLPHNFPRAKIFLGDAGSLLLGYSLGASAVLAVQNAPAGWGRLGPILLLAYPAFDMCFVVVNRLREGRKVYEGGKDHSNHRLASILQCPKRTVILVWAVGAALCASGLVVLQLNRPLPALALSGLWILLLAWAGLRLSSVPVARGTQQHPQRPAGMSPTPTT